MSGYTWRAAVAGDSALLYSLHRATMREYVEEVYGPWDDEFQLAVHEEWLTYSDPQVIECGAETVAVVDWAWRESDLYVGRIEVRPDRQRSGTGTMILEHLARLAAARSWPVVLEVIDINPARRLYERLGFEPFAVEGRKVHLRLDPRPTTTPEQ